MPAINRLVVLVVAALAATIAYAGQSATIHADDPNMPPLSDIALASLNGTVDFPASFGVDIHPDVTCYNRCYGIDRSKVVEAVNWFCNHFRPITLDSTGDFKNGVFSHRPDTHPYGRNWYDNGLIHMRIEVSQTNVGITSCNTVFNLDVNTCYAELMYGIIDGCNKGGENGKQGGFSQDGCLQFTVDPNPFCNPNCLVVPWSDDRGSDECASAEGHIHLDAINTKPHIADADSDAASVLNTVNAAADDLS